MGVQSPSTLPTLVIPVHTEGGPCDFPTETIFLFPFFFAFSSFRPHERGICEYHFP